MSQNNNITKSTKNKHLTERQRYDIECLLKEGHNARYIAQRIEKSKRTVEREIVRGTVTLRDSSWAEKRVYCADAGQRVYDENAKNKGPNLKIGKDHNLVK